MVIGIIKTGKGYRGKAASRRFRCKRKLRQPTVKILNAEVVFASYGSRKPPAALLICVGIGFNCVNRTGKKRRVGLHNPIKLL